MTTPGWAIRGLLTPTSADLYSFSVRLDQTSIRIDPRHDCIEPGETRQFTANVTGLEDYEVHWEVVSGWGSIDQNGLYQSLDGGTSNAEISAEIVGRPELNDHARIDVQGCSCSLSVEISGDANWSTGSADVVYQFYVFEDPVYRWIFEIPQDDGPDRMISASLMGVEVQFRAAFWDGGRWPCE